MMILLTGSWQLTNFLHAIIKVQRSTGLISGKKAHQIQQLYRAGNDDTADRKLA